MSPSVHLLPRPKGPDVCRARGEQAEPITRSGLALTVVLGPPGNEGGVGGVGDTVRGQRGLLLGRLTAQEDEMRLLPREEETRLFTRLAAAAGNSLFLER